MKTSTTLSVLVIALAITACGQEPSGDDATTESQAWRVNGRVIEFTPTPYD